MKIIRTILYSVAVFLLVGGAFIGWSYVNARREVAEACSLHPVLTKADMVFGKARLYPMRFQTDKLRLLWCLQYWAREDIELWELVVSFNGEILWDSHGFLTPLPEQKKSRITTSL